jgi:hypothetical protein
MKHNLHVNLYIEIYAVPIHMTRKKITFQMVIQEEPVRQNVLRD